jgi:hypothetical protein
MQRPAWGLALALAALAAPDAPAQPILFVSHQINGGTTVSRVPIGGAPITTYATGLNIPAGLDFSPDGSLFVANSLSVGTVSRVPPGGGAAQPYATGLTFPSGLAVGPDGSVYVANGGGLHTVSRIPPGGGAALPAKKRGHSSYLEMMNVPFSPVQIGIIVETWHFVEFWHVAASHTVYLDIDRSGAPNAAATASFGLKGTRPFFVGQDNAALPNYHKGLVDDLGLYSPIPPDAIRDGLYGGIKPY